MENNNCLGLLYSVCKYNYTVFIESILSEKGNYWLFLQKTSLHSVGINKLVHYNDAHLVVVKSELYN